MTAQHLHSAGLRLATAVAMLVLALAGTAGAHEIRPAYLQIDQVGAGRFSVLWRTPLLSGMRLPVVLQFSDGVENVTEPTDRQLPDSVVERRIVEAAGGLPGQRIDFVGLQATITDVLVRVKLQDGTVTTTLVRPSQPWIDIQARQSPLEVVKVFVVSGIEHLLFGFDHLLFVAALILIVRRWGMLLKTVTAFTVAHSITLTCATLGWVNLPSGPVEIMIAFSIVLVGAEIIRMERGGTSVVIEWPWIVAFFFGLLHGFGFAGALADFGLPQGDIPLALFSFNVGVELGQLMFIAAILLAVSALRRIVDVPRNAIIASAYVIGIVAAFWTVERLHSTFT
ncbi:HupE/UreJ family protein [Mesorhizobium sp. LjNodule214]|uniref:HupE/UreJ family protein n=1 Tax=Mesorhizobium sp. LjNodule214 TaxID=3342252 RepID=UPI003ECD2FCA